MRGTVRWLNGAFKAHFVAVLLGGVAIGAAFPAAGRSLSERVLFEVPVLGWGYDFSNLALGLMMLSAILGCQLKDFRKVLRRPEPAFLSLLVIYGAIPGLAAIAGLVWLRVAGSGDVQVLVGLMLSALMPVAMTSTLWVRLAAGNVPLLLTLITITTAFSVLSVPFYLHGLLGVSGAQIDIPTDSIVQQLVISVTLPLLLGLSARQLAPVWVDRAQETVSLLSNVALWLIVIANVAVASPHVREDAGGFLAAVVLAVLLNVVSYAAGLFAARTMRLSHEDALALVFGSGMRSNSTGLMLGLKAFPGMPLVAVPAAVYMISQHLFAAYLARRLERPGNRLLGTAVAVERRSLEAYLDRALPDAASNGLALVVVQLKRSGGLDGRDLHRLTRLVRRRVRQSDFVCVLGKDTFGLVLTRAKPMGVRLVMARLTHAAENFAPELELAHGVVHGFVGVRTPQQLIEAASRQGRLAPPALTPLPTSLPRVRGLG